MDEVEDILSDDEYEEGEILDEDILYEDVSSLEEFSESEVQRDFPSGHKRGGGRTVVSLRRKKEHQCPKQSPCRNERSGKLCYARLRKRQSNNDVAKGDGSSLESVGSNKVDENDRPRSHPQTRRDGRARSVFSRTARESRVNRRRYDKRRGWKLPPVTSTSRSSRQSFARSLGAVAKNFSALITPTPTTASSSSVECSATKSSLFDRLVGSGSIEPRPQVKETNDSSAKSVAEMEEGDDEVMMLRLEALKTAVLKKHEGRKKKGVVFNRKLNSESDNDPVNEFALTSSLDDDDDDHHTENIVEDSADLIEKEGVEQVEFDNQVLDSVKATSRPDNVIKEKCLREIDSNNSSNIFNKISKANRKRQRRRLMLFKRKGALKAVAGTEAPTDDNDEDLLRQIALQSVKPRKTVSPGELAQPGCTLMTSLHVDTDSTGKLSTNPSSAETWEDLDEDILRAQLLSSLSSRMPADSSNDSVVEDVAARAPKLMNRSVSFVNRVNKENARAYAKRNTSLNKVNVTRSIQPFIISLSQDSESSDDEEREPPEAEDICASIDLLLQDARQKTEQEQAMKKEIGETVKPVEGGLKKEKNDATSAPPKKVSKTAANATPMALRHLPVWQQEEYRQLKLRLAQKEKLRDEARRKCAAKIVKTDPLQLSALSNDSVAAPKAEPVQVSGESVENVTTAPVEPQRDEPLKPDSPATSTASEPLALPSSVPQLKTGLISKELSEMSEMVVNFEKELNDYRFAKKEIGRLRRELALASNELAKKRRGILLSKERIKNKEVTLAAKIPPVNSPLSPAITAESSEQRTASRELEIINLKFREVKLRAQVACISMSNDIKPSPRPAKSSAKQDASTSILPRKKMKLAPKALVLKTLPVAAAPSTNAKKVISVTEGDALDPFTALCPFDLSGVCKDEECKFQHVKTS